MTRSDKVLCAILFYGFFGLYLFTCAPHLAPYRDAGEMVSLLSTLGVAHPPGYPLYTLLGRLAVAIPFGNLVYRANLFSALCAAGALVFLFLTLRRWISIIPSVIGVGLLAFSNPFWDLATVSEMYALGMLWVGLLFFVTFRLNNSLLVGFLMALGLGVRMDLLLLVPFFVFWFWWNGERRDLVWIGLFFALGASVFLYLMVRSQTDPLIDWANPDSLVAVFNSARRKNYSGTLDLLSLSYRSGENFFINLKIYGQHLLATFGPWGVLFIVAGFVRIINLERRPAIFFSALFLVSGPVFLYLANMPPNPHSLAIVEASYLVPNLILALVMAFGVAWIPEHRKFFGLILVPLLAINAVHGYERASKRHNLYARDYIENVLRSLPKSSVAVFHKDVQLFSLWAAQLVENRRPDIFLLASGLSASPWYWEMSHRWPVASIEPVSIKEAGGWLNLKRTVGGRPLLAGYDVDLAATQGLKMKPQGTVVRLLEEPNEIYEPVPGWLTDVCLYRGAYVYGRTPDFFSTDLIGDCARAHHQMGFLAMMNSQPLLADWFFRRAESIDPTFARASSDRAYTMFTQNNVAGAYRVYQSAARKAERIVDLSVEYRSLPEVASGVRMESSTILTQLGAMAERLGKLEEARTHYLRAIETHENAQSHYNLAVTYWGRDWAQVISHMRRALELNPQMSEARVYLGKAMTLMGGRQP